MPLFSLELTTATLCLSASLRSDYLSSSLFLMLLPDLLFAFLNSLTFPPSCLINYTGFHSQIVSSSKLLIWFLSPNWVLHQNIFGITFAPLYLQLLDHSAL